MKESATGKLGPFVARLEQWFGAEQLPVPEAQRRLKTLGCDVPLNVLTEWRRTREQRALQKQFFSMLKEAGQQCRAIEEEFGRLPAPELETLIKVHRSMVLKLSMQANLTPEALVMVSTLMKPVLEWGRLEEKRRDREFAERKHEEQKAAQHAAKTGNALRTDTRKKIERSMKLLV